MRAAGLRLVHPALAAILAGAALAALAGCSTIPRVEAASDIHAFLVAIRDGDAAGFEAHVDRPALRTQLRSRVIAEVAASQGPASPLTIGAVAAGPLIGAVADGLVRPDVFRAVALDLGYDPGRPLPGTFAIATLVRPLEPGRACVAARRGGPCVLVFRDEDGTWRLVAFEGRLRFVGGRPVLED